jgi:hypothetical protein
MNYDVMKKQFESLPFMEAAKMIRSSRIHQHDLRRHMCETARQLMSIESSLDLVAAGYLHDVGKVVVATPKADGIYSIGQNHASVGRTIVGNMRKEFFVSLGLDQEKIAHVVGEHEFILDRIIGLRDPQIDVAVYTMRLFEVYTELKENCVSEDIIELFWADAVAKGGCSDIDELELYYKYFKSQCVSPEEIYRSRHFDLRSARGVDLQK